jgi:hypothetical protein
MQKFLATYRVQQVTLKDNMDTIITYEQARAQGLKRFYIGRTCKNGHTEEQLVSSRECVGCKREREARKYDVGQTGHAQYYKANRTRLLERQKINDANRRDEKVAYGRAWREAHPTYNAEYQARCADLFRFYAARRRAMILKATPPWVDLNAVKMFYTEAAARSEGDMLYEVDHIIPLVHPLVCGLHVPANLQVIPKVENQRKKNKFTLEG